MTDTAVQPTTPQPKIVPMGHLFWDTNARENGEWVDDIDGVPGARVLTKSWFSEAANDFRAKMLGERSEHLIEGSVKFLEAQEKDRVGHAIELEKISTLEGRRLVEFCVLGWENIGGIPFSKDNLKKVAHEPAAQPFRNLLVTAARSVGSMREEKDAAKLKNFAIGLGISFEALG